MRIDKRGITRFVTALLALCAAAVLCGAGMARAAEADDPEAPTPPAIGDFYGETLDDFQRQIDRALGAGNDLDAQQFDLQKLTPGALISLITDSVRRLGGAIFRPLLLVAAAVVLSGVAAAFSGSLLGGRLQGAFSIVSVLTVTAIVLGPITQLIARVGELLSAASTFLLSFVPVFAGIVAMGGQPVTGGAYSAVMLFVAQWAASLSANVFVPLIAIYLAFSLVSAAGSEMNIAAISRAIKAAVTGALGLVMTLFVGLVTLQGIAGSAADTAALRAAKFAVGSFLPVVGSAVSEALATLSGCVHLLKATVGTVGILALFTLFGTAIIEMLIWIAVLYLAALLADLIDSPPIAAVLRACLSALSMMLAVLVTFLLIVLISTTVILMMGAGV